jgi:hypothetical protein
LQKYRNDEQFDPLPSPAAVCIHDPAAQFHREPGLWCNGLPEDLFGYIQRTGGTFNPVFYRQNRWCRQ